MPKHRHFSLIHDLVRLCSAGAGEQAVIIDSLFETPLEHVEQALLQLVHQAVTQDENQQLLRRYLLFIAGKSLYISLRLSWIIDAVFPIFAQLGMSSPIQDLKDSVENVAITGNARSLQASGQFAEDAARKAMRCALFNDQRTFLINLTNISSSLRLVADRSKRKQELQTLLEDVNGFLGARRVMYPLGLSSNDVQWIVRVSIQDCTVFSSRERAPFLLVCEVVRDSSAALADPAVSTLVTAPEGPFPAPREPAHGPTKHERTRTQDSSSSDIDVLSLAFGETTSEKKARLRASSPFGVHAGWDLQSLIVKAGDDLRQEELSLQLIAVFNSIWTEAGLTCSVYPYTAISTAFNAGILQCIVDASSIDSIKKAAQVQSLHQFFIRAYGGEGSAVYGTAQRNFVESMAGYSVVCFLLQIKDRHNGNLMLTRAGHLVHIDFGFMLATSPGGWKFESAPFKLSQELVDVMGGSNSSAFNYFKVLIYQGMKAARDRAEEIIARIALMASHNTLPCFGADPQAVVEALKGRFRFDLRSDVEFAVYVKELISNSIDNWRTRKYDQFQTLQNGII